MTNRNAEITDLKRRVSNAVIVGVVSNVDHKKHRYRVKAGELESDWLPMTTARAGGTKSFSSLTEGEQVVVAAPNGDLSQGIIIGSVATNQTQAADKGNIHRTVYDDGTVVDYDHESHSYSMSVAAGGSFHINIGGGAAVHGSGGHVTISAPDGLDIEAPYVRNNGVAIDETHRHTEVKQGADTSGVPVGGS